MAVLALGLGGVWLWKRRSHGIRLVCVANFFHCFASFSLLFLLLLVNISHIFGVRVCCKLIICLFVCFRKETTSFCCRLIMQRLLKVLLCVCVSVTSACAFSLAEDETETAENSNGFMLFDLGRTDSVVSDARHMRRYLTEEGPDAPLYRGFGTHFVYVYVGTPKQRVSVIVDTGSHHTAFPCTGCNQCGDHTDLYFNPKESSTIEVPKCGGKNCAFSQSYTEGSMWTAYRVSVYIYLFFGQNVS